ncbi:unnamed protein product [Allacma fusca]|uniref:Uncharacterized protein n=1 Tax=Allacma fusca TaxID=39272 RepID=A0A8J2LI15_9HEXA|nr:unnamed protein product [Allacma fusca]
MECRTLVLFILIVTTIEQVVGIDPRILSDSLYLSGKQKGNDVTLVNGVTKSGKITVLYDSSSLDREYQLELLTAVQMAFYNLNEGDFLPQYIDLGRMDPPLTTALLTSTQWIINNRTNAMVSLLEPQALTQFIQIYDQFKSRRVLKVFTPRLVPKNTLPKTSVQVLCLQMSEMALSTALLNRVEKIGVKTLIPILDRDDPAQLEFLQHFIAAGHHRTEPIGVSSPLFVVQGEKSPSLQEVLNDERNSGISTGILLLATQGSQTVMEVANESKNILQMRWFSPNLMQYEEWALRGPESSNLRSNATFGIYSVHFVGTRGWDNPSRRKTLRELTHKTEASPRILSSILAYDAAWAARNYVKNNLDLALPMQGMSGEVSFDSDGYRQEGLYFGVSAVPELVSPLVTLLQPSKWILEDVINIVETIEGQYLITEYNVATSSMLTKEELTRFASGTSNSSDCQEHFMEIMTHDPFSQIATTYLFKKENLPYHLLIPNQHGYGITFMCRHADESRTTMKIACTPGGRFSDPVKCFRSHFASREKRQAQNRYRAYYGYNAPQSYANQAKVLYSRDDSNAFGNAYYGGQNGGSFNPSTLPTLTTRFDIPIVSEDVTSTTAPPPPAPKPLPELRQVLKASKPFVGSCVGAATGCAMCVLVLGRLPLGTLPPACTGPCFVGVFGSCGALLGRAFSETTVICTELFRQGYLDIDTFLADAEFGRQIIQQSPMIHKGYKMLATPLVEKMRQSKEFTEIVATFAIPWAKYMKYTLGYSDEFSWTGFAVNVIGSPICFIAGTIQGWTNNFQRENILPTGDNLSTSTTALLTLMFIFLLFQQHLQSRQKYRNHSS